MNKRSDAPELTVLIVAHNSEETIGAALHSILEQDFPMERVELLLVADRCTDATAERAREMTGEALRVIEIAEPPLELTARQAALHVGLSEARGEIVMIAEADGRVPRDWVHQLSGHISFRDGAVTAPSIHAGPRHFFARYQTLDAMVTFGLSHWMASHAMAAPVNSANLAIQRDAYLETGGFPALGFAPAEDAALGVRLKRSGWSVRYMTAPVTRVPAANSFRELLAHANRRDHTVPWLIGLIHGAAIASLAVLFACAMTMHGVWWVWFALRYALGIGVTSLCVALCGSYGMIRSAWYYEPVMTVMSFMVFVQKHILRLPWRWQGVRYSPGGPVQ